MAGHDSLPRFYDDNVAGFFPQGPGVVFAYWELSGSQWEVAAGLGGAVLVRLYRAVESEGFDDQYILVREVEPPPGTDNWYFNDLKPDSAYRFEIGCRLPDGSFFPLVGSEKISTPPAPRFNAMPKEKEGHGKQAAGLPEPRVAGGRAVINGPSPELGEIMEQMPFYMGFDTQLTGR